MESIGFLVSASIGTVNAVLLVMKLHYPKSITPQHSKNVKSSLLIQMKKPQSGRAETMGKSTLRSFQGSEGRPHLIEALISQPLVRDRNSAEAVAT